jgi:trehalose 6-phosphate phosphatase
MADVSPSLPSPPLLDDACALFLDVDGTLIDFAEHPDQVSLLPEVREVVERISARLAGALALVSGRPLQQLDRLFAPLLLPAAGLHGHDLRTHADIVAETESVTPAPAGLQRLQRRAAQLAQQHPGVLVEDKGSSLALHWRAHPQAGAAVLDFAHAQIDAMPGYRLQPGNHVVEFVPLGSDKGSAIEHLLGMPAFRNRTPVFIGDDLTDEHGFATVNRLGGWSILVGNRARTHARYALADTRAVHAWLHANGGDPH